MLVYILSKINKAFLRLQSNLCIPYADTVTYLDIANGQFRITEQRREETGADLTMLG